MKNFYNSEDGYLGFFDKQKMLDDDELQHLVKKIKKHLCTAHTDCLDFDQIIDCIEQTENLVLFLESGKVTLR